MKIVLEIADDLVGYLVPDGKEPERALLEDAVAEAYRAGRLSVELVRRLLGYEIRWEADQFLAERKIYDEWQLEEFQKDLATLNDLREKRELPKAS